MLTKMLSKTLGCLADGLGEARAFVHVLADLGQHDFEALVLGLLDHGVERLDERDVGFDEAGELAGHQGDLADADATAEEGHRAALLGLLADFSLTSVTMRP